MRVMVAVADGGGEGRGIERGDCGGTEKLSSCGDLLITPETGEQAQTCSDMVSTAPVTLEASFLERKLGLYPTIIQEGQWGRGPTLVRAGVLPRYTTLIRVRASEVQVF